MNHARQCYHQSNIHLDSTTDPPSFPLWLSYSCHSLNRLLFLFFGVDLGDGGGTMAEDDAGGFEDELFP